MRLPWLSRWHRAPRRTMRRQSAGLRVRRLERRRVLAASVTDIAFTPLDIDEGTQVTATSDATGTGQLFYEWSLKQGATTLAEGFDPDFVFTPPDEGTYEISLTVVDESQLPDSHSESIVVANVAPTLSAPGGGPIDGDDINEGQSATIVAAIIDPGAMDVFEVEVDWQDGGPIDTIADLGATDDSGTVGTTMFVWTAATRTLQLSHLYADDALSSMPMDTYDVELFVRDNADDMSGPYEADVVVRNLDPVLTVTTNKTIDEGKELDLSGMGGAPSLGVFTDAGDEAVYTASVDWGDGTIEAATVFASMGQMRIGGKHTYADDGVYEVKVTVADDDGGMDTESFFVTVENVVPLSAITVSSFTHFEGETFTLSVHFVDPGFDNPDNPNPAMPPDITDPLQETFTYDIDWGDGRDVVIGASVADVNGGPGVRTTGTFGGTHVYADDGVYKVTFKIRDDNNGVNTQSFFVTIKNADPMLVVPAVSPTTSEGALFSLAGLVTFSDPGFDNPLNPNSPMPPDIVDPKIESFTFDVDWGDGRDPITGMSVADTNVGTMPSMGTIPASHTYADDGEYTVTVTIYDDNGGSDTKSFTVMVENVAPLGAISVSSFTHFEGETFTLNVEFVDPGFDNPLNPNPAMPPDITDPLHESFTYDIDWGDGRDAVVGAVATYTPGGPGDPTTGSFGGAHVYADDGVYTLTFRLYDDNNGVDEQSFFITIQNVAPTLEVTPSAALIDEGGSVSFEAEFSDPGFDNPDNPTMPATGDPFNESFRYFVDWGDGRDQVPNQSVADTNGGPGSDSTGMFSGMHTYADDGTYTVTIRLADDNMSGNFAIGVNGVDFVEETFTVTVMNVQPTLTVTPSAAMIDEGGNITFNAEFRDPGFDNPDNPTTPSTGDPFNESFTYFLDWGDGREQIGSGMLVDMDGGPGIDSMGMFDGLHTYADDGTYTVTIRVADDNMSGNFATGVDGVDFVEQTFTVVVNNVRPTLDVTASMLVVDEGQSVSFEALFSDPGFDNPDNPTTPPTGDPLNESFRYFVDWGDGRDQIPDQGVADTDGGPGVDTTGMFSGMHTYADDGTYTVTVRIADDNMSGNFATGVDGVDFVEQTFTVVVNNVRPMLAVTPSAAMIDEGGSVSFIAEFSDPGFDNPDNPTTPPTGDPINESFTYFLDWGDGRQQIASASLTDSNGGPGVDTTGMFDGTHTYADDGTYTVTVRIADDNMTANFATGVDGVDFVEQTFTVVVENVRPTLNVTTSTLAIDEGQSVSFGALFSDPGFDNPDNPTTPSLGDPLNESFRYFVDWGDGRDQVPNQSVLDTNGSPGVDSTGAFNGSHTYADDGAYTLRVRLADDNMTGNFASGVAGVDFVEQTFTVVVSNVAPFLTGTTNLMVNEGQAFTLDDLGVVLEDFGFDNPLNPTTPTLGDPLRETFTAFSINWGDGRGTSEPVSIDNVNDRVSGSPGVTTKATFTHTAFTYADDGVYTVTIRVADDNMSGNIATGVAGVDFVDLTFTITVNNVRPTLTAIANQTINESEDLILPVIGTFTDPGFDNPANPNAAAPPTITDPLTESFRYFLDWGDGREQIVSLAVADTNGSPGVLSSGMFGGIHNYADNGVYTVTIRLADDNMTGNFATGEPDVDFVEQTFTVTVLNLPPAFVPLPNEANLQGDEVNTDGITTIRVAYNDPGYDNPLNTLASNGGETVEMFNHVIQWGDGTVDAIHPYVTGGSFTVTVMMTPADGPTQTFTFTDFSSTNPVLTLVSSQQINDPGVMPQVVTYIVNWGDGHTETFQLSLLNPGPPVASNGLTTLVTTTRNPGNATTLTTGSAAVQHRYLGPPDPLHPTADIMITLTVFDDDGAGVTDSIFIGNPGIDVVNVAIDTTPDVPRIDLSPPPITDFFIPVQSAINQVLQGQDVRGSGGEATSTADRYLELRVVYPDGTEGPGNRIKDEALLDLRAFFRTLPDGRYRIYLVRSETKVPRLVIEVDVRRGRVVDVSDESEGTRDRPPTAEEQSDANEMLEQNPHLEAVPDGERQGDKETRRQGDGDRDGQQVALAAALAVIPWSGRLDRALEQANEADWRRLRRAGRRARVAQRRVFPRLKANPNLDYNRV